MERNFDLLGDPIPANWGGRGRPAHIPTQENRSKVRLLLAFGWTAGRIASALRVTGATLRKHYFADLKHREEARPALQASRLLMIYKAAAGGNVGAMKELGRELDKDELVRPLPREIEPEQRPERLGKKDAANRDAPLAHLGTGWSKLLQ